MNGLEILRVLISGVVGYLLGSINSSLVVGRLYKTDVRLHGSSSAGLTNTLRTLGKKAAALVLAGDVLKGVLAALFGLLMAGDVSGVGQVGVMAGGLCAVIGHNWPLYFGFRGGKGALTSVTVVFMMDWRIGLAIIAVFAVIVAVTRYVSLGSIVCSVLFPILAAMPFFKHTPLFVIFALLLGMLSIYKHSPNIKRLVTGTESKLGEKKTDVDTR